MFEFIPETFRGSVVFFIALIVFGGGFIYFVAKQQSDFFSTISEDSYYYRHPFMKLVSPDFEHEAVIPREYTCDGENINPVLYIRDVPSQAQSLVLLMDDPDVPTSVRADNNWDHWVVFNIPPTTARIDKNSVPEGAIVGRSTSGANAYGGPCPPDGEHRYFFKVYALDTVLDLTARATKQDVLNAMEGHIYDQTELMGRYTRQ